MRKKPMTVLIDMDNTIVDWTSAVSKEWKKLPKNKHPNDKNDKSLNDIFSLPDRYQEDMQHMLGQPNFYYDMDPLPGAIDTLRVLKVMGELRHADFILCTHIESYEPYAINDKKRWIHKHLGSQWENVIFVTGSNDKSNLGADLIIDDSPDVLTKCKCATICYSQPYNTHIPSLIPSFTWSHRDELIRLILNFHDLNLKSKYKNEYI